MDGSRAPMAGPAITIREATRAGLPSLGAYMTTIVYLGDDRAIPVADPRVAGALRWDGFTRLACQTRVRGDVTLERLIKSSADMSCPQVERAWADTIDMIIASMLGTAAVGDC